mgnify:CR=1 FL=1
MSWVQQILLYYEQKGNLHTTLHCKSKPCTKQVPFLCMSNPLNISKWNFEPKVHWNFRTKNSNPKIELQLNLRTEFNFKKIEFSRQKFKSENLIEIEFSRQNLILIEDSI